MTDTQSPPPGPPAPTPPERRRAPEEPRGSSPARLAALVGAVIALGLLAGLSAVIVVLAIVVMIFLHELGHYLTAKWAGMKVTEFFIGFGPRIWSFSRGETEYGVKAIPAGAYVRIIGMNNLDEVDPADEERAYRQKPYWRRMSVAVAGSTMHFLIAIACLFALFVGWGVTDDARWEIGRLAAVDDGASPAALAGVEVGDEIEAVEGAPVTTFDDLRDELAAYAPGDTVTVGLVRDGRPLEVEVTLGTSPSGGAFLGVGPEYPSERLDPLSAAGRAVTDFGRFTWESTAAIGRFFTPGGLSEFIGGALGTDDEPAADGAGSGDPAVEGGENRVLSIYGAARIGAQATESGAAGLLGFLVLINIFIGVFNLVPLLPLDGGHVAVATYEKARELLSRSSARYHADVAKLLPLTYVVVAVLISIGLLALYLDIADPVDLPQ